MKWAAGREGEGKAEVLKAGEWLAVGSRAGLVEQSDVGIRWRSSCGGRMRFSSQEME